MEELNIPAAQELAELKRQKEELENQISIKRREVIEQVKAAIEAYGLTADDLGYAEKTPDPVAAAGRKLAAKYRSPDGTETWSGRGKMPVWMKKALEEGFNKEDMLIDPKAAPAKGESLKAE